MTLRAPTSVWLGDEVGPGEPPSFRPSWWCRSRHLQTVWGPLFRRARLPLSRERVPTGDGDFVDLDWADGAPGQPLLLVLHGLEGSARSHYVTGLFRAAADRGWRGVALNFRSCSGELNRLPRFYHSGDTGDLDAVVRSLVEREPGIRIGAAGVSLGGNVLLKWLGERGPDAPPELVGAVGISVPFDLASCARRLDRGLARVVYTANFLRTLRRKVRLKADVYPGFVDLTAVRRARTFAEYDRAVTAPLHGFADERDYWTRASSGPYLGRIRRPTLLINALDDPLVPAESLPDPTTLPAAVRVEVPRRGGHAGFIDGRWRGRASSWAERRAVEFLGHCAGTVC
ncbi:MAG TPA: alpha/beta fold hydrolase [Methylomirabilota bacterium]|nr:alpha/beta fold hydrolase [Methylomirabilota bacterium]